MKRSVLKKICQVTKNVLPPSTITDENVKKCKKCQSELFVLSRQTRSADEGATTFYNCKKCAYTIKIN